MTAPGSLPSPAARLAAFESRGGEPDAVLTLFDSLPPTTLPEMVGRWHGFGVPTRHEMDGLLEALGWYGKAFFEDGRAHPLLFRTARGGVIAIDPAWIPVTLARDHGRLFGNVLARAAFALTRPILRTNKPRAQLCQIEHRDVWTMAMVYDAQPIRDIFRQVDADTLLGLMEMRGMNQPFFFGLRRAGRQTGVASRPLRATP